MSNEIIVAEKKNGHACVTNAFVCTDEADFIDRIRATQLRYHNGKSLVETVEEAIEYNDNAFCLSTSLINREEFDAYAPDSWVPCILQRAIELDWYQPNEE